MNSYFIKYIWGPDAQRGCPWNDLVYFAEGQEKAYQRFRECRRFLLYETGSKEGDQTGAKAIYARGIIASDQPSFIKEVLGRGKKFSYAVKVNLQKRVDPKKGIPLDRIRETTGVGRNIQRKGGLLEVTKEQFEKLSNCL